MGTIQICFLLGLLSQSILSNALEQRESFIDPGVILVERWDGWGTSLAWWADIVGGLEEDVITSVTRALFHADKLNFNIVRYVIGGTTPNKTIAYPCGDYRPGAATESYKDGPSPTNDYDWTRDPRQRDILLRAKALGVNTFEAFSNSPPQWMTISGCSKGSPNDFLLHNNLLPEKADEFADYATEVILHFRNTFGVTFTTYAPFNEPFGLRGIGSWFGQASSQEGCNMNRTVMTAVVRSVHKAITEKGMDFLSITTADETQINTALQTQEFLNKQGLSSMISKVNVHGYWDLIGSRRDLLSILCHTEGQRLWMDEMGWGESSVGNMTQGLLVANTIVKDVRNMLPSAWIYWQAVEDVGSWGLIGVPYSGSQTVEDIRFNSGYYAMMQFSKYIKQGFKIIVASDKDSIAAMDEKLNTLIIVTINNGLSPVSKKIDLRLFPVLGIVKATKTSANRTNVFENNVSIDNEKFLHVETVAESITTIVISNIKLVDEQMANLIINGDFESKDPAEIAKWSLEIGDAAEGGLNSKFPWRGNTSGFLGVSAGNTTKRRLTQVIKVPKDNKTSYQLFLTAWCSTTGVDTRLSLNIVVLGVSKEAVVSGGLEGYRMYDLTLKAKGGDEVKVQFDSFSGQSYIDNVVLHYVEVEPDREGQVSGGIDKGINYVLVLVMIVINMY